MRLPCSTLPYLDAPAATELLARAVPEDCRAETGPARAWLDLYAAVAARDATRMWQAAETLLHAGASDEPAKHTYVLVAALLGRLADGQPEQVLRVWEQQRQPAETADDVPDARLLLDAAAQRIAIAARGH